MAAMWFMAFGRYEENIWILAAYLDDILVTHNSDDSEQLFCCKISYYSFRVPN